jgi:hypothetical protein
MDWNFGRWVSSMTWPGIVAWLSMVMHTYQQHGPPWDVFNFIGGGP